MMWTWAEIWRSPSTLTIGGGGVRATSGGAVPTSASAEMMILDGRAHGTPLCMWQSAQSSVAPEALMIAAHLGISDLI